MNISSLFQLYQSKYLKYPDVIEGFYKREGQWRSQTYKEGYETILNLSYALISSGAKKGSRIAMTTHILYESFKLDMAIHSIGAISVALQPDYPSLFLQQVLNHCQAQLILVEDRFQMEKVLKIRDQLPYLQKIVVWEEMELDKEDDLLITYKDFLKMGLDARELSPNILENISSKVQSIDPAVILYNRNDQGLPRGIVLSHSNILTVLDSLVKALPLEQGESLLLTQPLCSHLQRMLSYLSLLADQTLYFPEKIVHVEIDIAYSKPTIQIAHPFFYKELFETMNKWILKKGRMRQWLFHLGIRNIKRDLQSGQNPSSLPLIQRMRYRLAKVIASKSFKNIMGGRLKYFYSSPQLPQELKEYFYSVGYPIYQFFDLDEASGFVSVASPEKENYNSVGKPLLCNLVKLGTNHRIHIRGDNLFKGYLNENNAMESKINEDGWLETDYQGTINDRGLLYIQNFRAKGTKLDLWGRRLPLSFIKKELMSYTSLIHQIDFAIEDSQAIVLKIQLDEESLILWCLQENIHFISTIDTIKHPSLIKFMDRLIYQLNLKLAEFEKIHHYQLMEKSFAAAYNSTFSTKDRKTASV